MVYLRRVISFSAHVLLAMPSIFLRGVLGAFLLVALAACDAGRSDLTDDPNDTPVRPVDPLEGSCAARIDGQRFAADVASASVNTEGVLDMRCDGAEGQLLFRLQTEAYEPVVLPLGVPGNRAQYRVGQNVMITNELPDGSDIGQVEFEVFTRDKIEGTFYFNVLSTVDGTSIIRVTSGNFEIELP